jgi:alanine transaminase
MTRLSLKTISPLVKVASYAVRGPIVALAAQLKGKLGDGSLPFSEVVSCNIGNPQALKQAPLSWIRDVAALTVNPGLVDRVPKGTFAADVIARANHYLHGPGGATSMGSYTDSKGILAVRNDVAHFLNERDGFEADTDNIFLTNGASDGVRICMQTIMRPISAGFNDGVLTPIPQYPLYSALTKLLDGHLVPYYLDESKTWACTKALLEESLHKANSEGIDTRCLVVINPGNPTGQVLSLPVMEEIITFCNDNEIVLMADEVYQENIWAEGAQFHSFRKVAHDMDVLKGDKDGLQLISFHSVSKGFLGECGLRGGYFEVIGVDPEVRAEILKLASISLCSNTVGQVTTGLMVRPPVEGDESYPLYKKEKSDILDSLKRRASKLTKSLNQLEGIECTESEGALYAFPTIKLSSKAIAAAKDLGMEADAFYCTELLEKTGLVTVPGSGFKQVEGTYHFRITILPPEETLDAVFKGMETFHNEFMAKYA